MIDYNFTFIQENEENSAPDGLENPSKSSAPDGLENPSTSHNNQGNFYKWYNL